MVYNYVSVTMVIKLRHCIVSSLEDLYY